MLRAQGSQLTRQRHKIAFSSDHLHSLRSRNANAGVRVRPIEGVANCSAKLLYVLKIVDCTEGNKRRITIWPIALPLIKHIRFGPKADIATTLGHKHTS